MKKAKVRLVYNGKLMAEFKNRFEEVTYSKALQEYFELKEIGDYVVLEICKRGHPTKRMIYTSEAYYLDSESEAPDKFRTCIVGESVVGDKGALHTLFKSSSCSVDFKRYTFKEQRRVFGFVLFGKKCIRWVEARQILGVANNTNNDRSRRLTVFNLDEIHNRILITQEIR